VEDMLPMTSACGRAVAAFMRALEAIPVVVQDNTNPATRRDHCELQAAGSCSCGNRGSPVAAAPVVAHAGEHQQPERRQAVTEHD